MRKLPARQVHLDFHTSEWIDGVARKFDKRNFQEALRLGNVNSITVFAKCHHGWCYYPTKVGRQHPTMEPGFDLTGAMIDAAHEVGVAAPVYITLGWSVQDAEDHPEWLMRRRDGSVLCQRVDLSAAPEDPRPECSWKDLCCAGGYREYLYRLTQEVCDRYAQLDGLFFDIVYLEDACYCDSCLQGMRAAGLNPDDPEDARAYYREAHLTTMRGLDEILHRRHPEATLFFNSGGADIYRPEYHAGQTHFEMEDLPTTWGGYNKMPPRASFMRRYPKEFLGMTGKFHTEWGEFGGYKNPEALKFEVAMMAMYGARCSIGDQMPPNGRMDLETYRLMGPAYRYLQSIEPWCYREQSTTRLGVYLSGDEDSDQGLHNMLLERQLDFEIVRPGDALERFEALVLPDSVALTDGEAARLQAFVRQGGALLLTGLSGVSQGRFQLDVGAEYLGAPNTRQDYLELDAPLNAGWVSSPFLCYRAAQRVRLTSGQALGRIYEPWFDRTYARYCSHRNTPYREEPAAHPGAVKKGRVIYLPHALCGMYKRDGAQIFRDALVNALLTVYRPNLRVKMPSAGRARLTHQPEEHRYVLHLLYGSPIQRGRTSVIEDLPPLYQVEAEVVTAQPVTQVRLVPSGEALPFRQADGQLRFTVPKVETHQAVEVLY